MKVLVISDSFPKDNFDGIFVYKRLLCFQKNGIEFLVIKPKICLRKNLRLDFEKDYSIESDGTSVPVKTINCIRIPGSYELIGFSNQLKKIVNEFNPDIIHCHFVWNAYNVLKSFRKKNVPVVLTAHGSDIHTFPNRSGKLKNQTKFVLKRTETSIFVSDFLRKKADNIHGNRKTFFVIPNGIDDYFINNIVRKKEKKAEKNIIYIGRLERIKRVELLPEILFRIIQSGFDVNLHIVGNGSQKDLIVRKAKDLKVLDKIIFYGQVEHEQLPNLLSDKDCLLLISKNEGWPCVVLEAQACGVPVIGTANGGIPEAIGDGGIIVNDEALVENVAVALKNILDNPFDPKRLRDRAAQFTWEKIVEKEVALYSEVLKNANRNT